MPGKSADRSCLTLGSSAGPPASAPLRIDRDRDLAVDASVEPPGAHSARGPASQTRAARRPSSRSWRLPEMEGRRGEGARKAAAFLIEEFRRLKLEPLFQGQFVQEIPAAEPGRIQGRNVGAVFRGRPRRSRTSGSSSRPITITWAFAGGVLYPGADDNASGVAMMLEVARSMAAAPEASAPQPDVHRLRPRGGRALRLALLRRPSARAARARSRCSSRPT